MCLGGSVGRMTPPQREYQNRPVTVSGSQTGVDDPPECGMCEDNDPLSALRNVVKDILSVGTQKKLIITFLHGHGNYY